MEGYKNEPEAVADENMCYGQEMMSSVFPAHSSSLLPPFLEGRGPAAPSLPSSRPSSGPAEGDPPPFAAHQLSPGAFRPLNPSSSSASSSPPSFVVQHQPLFREDLDRLTPSSDVSSSSLDRLTPDDATQRTLRKRRAGSGLSICSGSVSSGVPGHCNCPVCGITVRPHELQAHFRHESKLLDKIPKQVSRQAKDVQATNTQGRRSSSPISSVGPSSSVSGKCDFKNTRTSRTEIFARVRSNRSSRLNARSGRAGGSSEDYREAECPICHKHLQGTASQLNRHAEVCIRKRSGELVSSEDEEVDVEGQDSREDYLDQEGEEDEYRWAGQTRVRFTSLLRGNYEACGFTTVRPSAEDDEDLNVDGDDTVTYGQPQYSESDVIPCQTDSTSGEEMALRRAVSTRNEDGENSSDKCQELQTDIAEKVEGDDSGNKTEDFTVSGVKSELLETEENCDPPRESTQSDRESRTNSQQVEQAYLPSQSNSSDSSLQTRPTDQRLLIAALHHQISELRANGCQSGQAVLKCLVCMDPYKKPVVSVGCWHVYCEECWLRTLGAKKLCPQCNTITSASDLRKIYM